MNSSNLRVHISPVGFDPVDRIAGPLLQYKADKVYLVSKGKNDRASLNMTQIKAKLKEHPHIELHEVYVDIWDLFCCLEKFRSIFESERGNHIHVNVSTGSKITAIAGMLACMLWKGAPYYAQLDYDGNGGNNRPATLLDTRKVQDTEFLPVYQINMPVPESLQVLSIIDGKGSGSSSGRMSKKELIEELQQLKIIPVYPPSKSRSAPHSRLRAILDSLELQWQFVETRSRGRSSEVSLTEQGKSALRIFGTGKGVL